jgi:cytidine diphosphoramidate kinase
MGLHTEGALLWITGLSGAGKTTIAKLVTQSLRRNDRPVVHLDGDQLRPIFNASQAHRPEDRKTLANNYSALAKLLVEQDIDVVLSTISMFSSVRKNNRETIRRYFEIYLNVPLDILIERDQKYLYTKALKGEIDNVLGVDLPYDEPMNSNLVIVNDGRRTPEECALEIVETYENYLKSV